jgi:hypothetical protein
MKDEAAVTNEILSESINRMKEPKFDSHAIIRDVMTNHPKEYTKGLYGHVGTDDPIQTFHARIGSSLAGFPSIEKTEKVLSLNVRGQVTENQEWKKK